MVKFTEIFVLHNHRVVTQSLEALYTFVLFIASLVGFVALSSEDVFRQFNVSTNSKFHRTVRRSRLHSAVVVVEPRRVHCTAVTSRT